MTSIKRWLSPIEGLPWWRFYARILWVVVQVFLAFSLITQANPFFYQAF